MAKCQADIVGLVSGESTIIITVDIRMRKYWINLLDKKFVWKWSLLWWGLCVQNVKSNIQKNWWLFCQFAHEFLILKKNKFDTNNYASNECENEKFFLNLLEFIWICLNLFEFTCRHCVFCLWVTDRRTDPRMDPQTDPRMDKASYRDVWTHLKITTRKY